MHTPGPWYFTPQYRQDDESPYRVGVYGSQPGRDALALVQGFSVDGDGGWETNARLIAAAPELLNALELAWGRNFEVKCGCGFDRCEDNRIREIIAAAIAKATDTT